MKRTNRLFGIAILSAMIIVTTAFCGCEENETNKATPDSAVATVDEATNEDNTLTTLADGTNVAADNTNKDNSTGDNKTAATANGKPEQNDKNSKTTNNKGTNNAAEKNNDTNTANNGNSNKTNNTNNGGTANTNNSGSKSNNSNGNSGSGKTWHDAVYEDIYHPAETKQVKVVDKEAYSYEEPVYDYVYHAICNTCGADITNNRYEHTKAHTIAHEGGSWSDVPKYEQTGTKTVNVPEQSHYETQTVKAAWTEHKLVREAGYY